MKQGNWLLGKRKGSIGCSIVKSRSQQTRLLLRIEWMAWGLFLPLIFSLCTIKSTLLILSKLPSFSFPGFHFSRFQDRLRIPPASLAPLTAAIRQLSHLPTPQRIILLHHPWIPWPTASRRKVTHTTTIGLPTPRTTTSPQPPLRSATGHPVKQSIWMPWEPQSSFTPAQTMRTLPPQQPSLAISIKGKQAVISATVCKKTALERAVGTSVSLHASRCKHSTLHKTAHVRFTSQRF